MNLTVSLNFSTYYITSQERHMTHFILDITVFCLYLKFYFYIANNSQVLIGKETETKKEEIYVDSPRNKNTIFL